MHHNILDVIKKKLFSNARNALLFLFLLRKQLNLKCDTQNIVTRNRDENKKLFSHERLLNGLFIYKLSLHNITKEVLFFSSIRASKRKKT